MRVFVTGATGYVGQAVVSRLLRAGHQVSGLVRTDAAARRLAADGGVPVLGALRTLASLIDSIAGHDAVVHTAFEYRADGSEADEVDRGAVDAMLEALHRGDRCRQLVYTSNGFLLADIPPAAGAGSGSTIDEGFDTARAVRPGTWRLDVERRVIDAAGGGLATAVVRVGAVYGGVGGSFPDFFRHARATATLGYIGDGANRWSLIHRDDLAELFATVVERDGRGVFHGVDGAPLAMREIMALVAASASAGGRAVDVRAVPLAQATAELPYYASVLACDLAMVTPRALALGWTPAIASFRDGVVATAVDVLG